MFEVTYTRRNGDIVKRTTVSLLGARMACEEYAEMDGDKLTWECFENLWHAIAGDSVLGCIERLPS